jgi:hypothetical protein
MLNRLLASPGSSFFSKLGMSCADGASSFGLFACPGGLEHECGSVHAVARAGRFGPSGKAWPRCASHDAQRIGRELLLPFVVRLATFARRAESMILCLVGSGSAGEVPFAINWVGADNRQLTSAQAVVRGAHHHIVVQFLCAAGLFILGVTFGCRIWPFKSGDRGHEFRRSSGLDLHPPDDANNYGGLSAHKAESLLAFSTEQ